MPVIVVLIVVPILVEIARKCQDPTTIGTMIGTTTRESTILSVHNSVEVVDKKHFAGKFGVFAMQRERPW